jgi:hypothetical protein
MMPSDGVKNRSRTRRSAGTAGPLQVLGRGLRGPSQESAAADIRAVDQGDTVWLSCFFRATYGSYPRKFSQKILDLTSDGMVIRPFWATFRRTAFRIREDVLDSGIRAYNFRTDYNIKATGVYAEGRRLSYAGFEIIVCRTEDGVIELAVPRPDIPLVLHYLRQIRDRG